MKATQTLSLPPGRCLIHSPQIQDGLSLYEVLCVQFSKLYSISLSSGQIRWLTNLKEDFQTLYFLINQKVLIIQNEELQLFNFGKQLTILQAKQICVKKRTQFELVKSYDDVLILFQLYFEPKSEKDQNTPQFILNLFEIDLKANTILFRKEILLQASVRALILRPANSNRALLFNPNSVTNRNFPFILWSDSREEDFIRVKTTSQEIRGTMVEVIPYQRYFIFIYNSNGIASQYILLYDSENHSEEHVKIEIGRKFLFKSAIINGNTLILSCLDLREEFDFDFDLISKSVIQGSLKQSQFVHKQLYNQRITLELNNENQLFVNFNVSSQLQMIHYMTKVLASHYGLHIIQELADFLV